MQDVHLCQVAYLTYTYKDDLSMADHWQESSRCTYGLEFPMFIPDYNELPHPINDHPTCQEAAEVISDEGWSHINIIAWCLQNVVSHERWSVMSCFRIKQENLSVIGAS